MNFTIDNLVQMEVVKLFEPDRNMVGEIPSYFNVGYPCGVTERAEISPLLVKRRKRVIDRGADRGGSCEYLVLSAITTHNYLPRVSRSIYFSNHIGSCSWIEGFVY